MPTTNSSSPPSPPQPSSTLATTLSDALSSSQAPTSLNSDERRPLLHPRSTSRFNTLKRKSAVVSDFISGHHHSGFDLSNEVEAEGGGGGGLSAAEEGEQGFLSDGEGVEGPGGLRRRRSKRYVGYDGEFRLELEGEGGNGVRQWYASFASVDWIHDAVKSSIRQRRLRARKQNEGLRGFLANLWDGSQGWILTTLIGLFTASIAFLIISSEMLLFDLKEGYCTKSVFRAKRFCCRSKPPIITPASLFSLYPTHSTFLTTTTTTTTTQHETCKHWQEWSTLWSSSSSSSSSFGSTLFGYLAYILLAILFATLASTATIYLTASDQVYSSKDSPNMPHPGFHPSFPPPPSSSSPSYGSTSTSTTSPPPSSAATAIQLGQKPRKIMYFAAGSGIPEVKTILSGFVLRGYLGSWTLVTKSVGLALSVGSGLSLGKEGPFVHISSCVGNILSRFASKYDRNEAKRREIISAACAAGVAVSFGAPVGGTLFSLEEVSYFFPPRVMVRSFWCAMVAALTLKLLDPFGSGKIVLFAVTYDRDWHTFELVGFAFLGLFGGIYGALFCKANIWWTRNVRNGTFLKRHPIVEVGLITFTTTLFAFYSPWTKMGGTELVYELFSECHRNNTFSGLCISLPSQVPSLLISLSITLLIKFLLTTITFGLRLPAGVFIPTLAIGACAGRIAGLLVELAHASYPTVWVFEACRTAKEDGPLPFGQSCVLPGVWAMVGAAAALAGVTRTTVSLAVIMFELTGTLTYVLPVMLGVMVAKTVADAIEPRSIYDLVIELADLPYLDAKTEYIHESTPGDIVDLEAPVISLDEPNSVESLREKLVGLYSDGLGGGFPIVAKEEGGVGGVRMYGYIASKELEHGLSSSAFALPLSTPITFRTCSAFQAGQSLSASRATTPGVGGGCDLSWLVDGAPLSVSIKSPMELVHELFIKLGARYLVVVDEKGRYKGVLEKVRYLAYLRWLEKVAHEKGKGHWRKRKSSTNGAGGAK